MSNVTLEDLEVSINEAKQHISKMQAMQRLISNPDFNQVITEGYFEKEASRLVLLKADPNMQKDSDQNMINKAIDSIGYLRQYFTSVMQFGRMAEKAMKEDEATREELLTEAL
jgi:hypothetical protein